MLPAKGDANTIIIVSDPIEKIALLKDIKIKENFKDMLYTVSEAKGLEFKKVICYNLISSNLSEWKKILNEEAKTSREKAKGATRVYNEKDKKKYIDAILENNVHKVEKFLRNGFNPNFVLDEETQYTSLMYATMKGNIRIVKRLLEYGANIDAKMKDGITIAFDLAEVYNRKDIKAELIKRKDFFYKK